MAHWLSWEQTVIKELHSDGHTYLFVFSRHGPHRVLCGSDGGTSLPSGRRPVERRVLYLADDVHLRLVLSGHAHSNSAHAPHPVHAPPGLHEELQVLVSALLPRLPWIPEHLPVLSAPAELVRWRHPLPAVPLVVVVSLRHPGLSVDVWDSHAPLLVQLPVERAHVLHVVLITVGVEETETGKGTSFRRYLKKTNISHLLFHLLEPAFVDWNFQRHLSIFLY